MNPFSTDKASTIGAWGESHLLKNIQAWLGKASPPAPQGIGDDCAVMDQQAGKALLTVDSMIFKKHFDASHSPEAVGAKLLKRNLSDIAAMGGQPRGALVALCLGDDVAQDYLKRFYRGLAQAARQYSCPILGGDVASTASGHFLASLTLYGSCETPVLRSGSPTGSSLWVTGSLGGSLLGRHLDFEPHLPQGQWLARHRDVCAMLDISDGLAKDVLHLLADQQAAHLYTHAIPIDKDAHKLAEQTGKTAWEHALTDGEDYCLLFTLKPEANLKTFQESFAQEFSKTSATQIGILGEMDASGAKLLNAETGDPIILKGYEHFNGYSKTT